MKWHEKKPKDVDVYEMYEVLGCTHTFAHLGFLELVAAVVVKEAPHLLY